MTTDKTQLKAALDYWTNCLGKGTAQQQAMVARTIADIKARLGAAS